MSYNFDDLKDGLYKLLNQASPEDLGILVDYITDKGEGRISLSSEKCRQLVSAKGLNQYSKKDTDLIAEEIRSFGGNTIANLFRSEPIPYTELVQDVADHLKVSYAKGGSDYAIELAIIQKMFIDSIEKMAPSEREAMLKEMGISDSTALGPAAVSALITAGRFGGFATYQMVLSVANAIAKAILGRGLSLGTNAAITRATGVLLGPVGWVLTGLWTAYDLASPAYRVTVPCVIQVALIRQKAITDLTHAFCSNADCGALNPKTAAFCPSCGTKQVS